MAKAAIFWLSIVRSMARILSRSAGRALVLGPFGGRRHLAPERLDERLLATLEEQLDLLDVGPVGVLARWP